MGRPRRHKDTTRLNLDLIPKDRSRLEELVVWMEEETMASAVRRLFRVFHDLVPHLLAGGRLTLHRADGTEADVIILPVTLHGREAGRG